MTVGTTDCLQTFLVDDGMVRGRVVRLGPSLDRILADHDYPVPVARLLGECLVLSAALAGALKFDGIFTLQIQSDGPVSLLVADVTSDGAMRGYARFDATALPSAMAAAEPLLGEGYLALTIDQGPDSDRYQGIVELDGPAIEKSAIRYFEQSEQLATSFKLAVQAPQGDQGWRAAALMVQRMPDDPNRGDTGEEVADEAYRRAAILMATARDNELFDIGLPTQKLLFRLFHAEGLVLHEPQALRAQCRCSGDRVAMTLASFPTEEIADLQDDDGKIVVTCEFCRTDYVFTTDDLSKLHAS